MNLYWVIGGISLVFLQAFLAIAVLFFVTKFSQKSNTLFYRLFEAFPGIFFELINRSPEEAENYQFASV